MINLGRRWEGIVAVDYQGSVVHTTKQMLHEARQACCRGSVVDLASLDSTGDVGSHASLAFDVAGRAIIAYHRADTGTLKFWTDANSDLAAQPTEFQTIPLTGMVGRFASLWFDPARNAPLIAFRDDTQPGLRFTAYLDWDGDGECFRNDHCPQRRPGDINGDGQITAADAAAFVAVLLDPDSTAPAPRCAADLDGNGAPDGDDIGPFTALLAGP